jgi:hypothetical protein
MFVLQSGNHEFICIRHRHTQTLYVSELIKPHACREPSYGKLHVGLYIAAVMDTIDREKQVSDAQPRRDGDGPSGSAGGDQDRWDDDNHEGPRRDEGRWEPKGGGWTMQPKESDSSKKRKYGGTWRGKAVRSTGKKMVVALFEMAAEVCFV